MRPKYDACSKWLIETFAAELLRLAGVGPDVTVRPLPSELVQSRQLPDGLIEVTYPSRGTVPAGGEDDRVTRSDEVVPTA